MKRHFLLAAVGLFSIGLSFRDLQARFLQAVVKWFSTSLTSLVALWPIAGRLLSS
jgi:hypothetical protein